MQLKPRSSRFAALFTGFVLASAAVGIAPAQAVDKSKKLKYGAIALGVAGAYLLSKGKTVPAAAVAAGGYYAYKKSQKAADEERFGSNRDRYDARYGYNPDREIYSDNYESEYRSNADVRPSRRQGRRNYDLNAYLR